MQSIQAEKVIPEILNFAAREDTCILYGIGPGGSGKGTKFEIVTSVLSRAARIVTSEAIEDAKQHDNELGRSLLEQQEAQTSGGLIKDIPVLRAVNYRAQKEGLQAKRLLALDGVPRNRIQLDMLPKSKKRTIFVYFDITLKIALNRAQQRTHDRISRDLPPRPDDAPDIVQKRYSAFLQETYRGVVLHLLEHHAESMVTIDATTPIRDQVITILDKLGLSRGEYRQAIKHLDDENHQAGQLVNRVQTRRPSAVELMLAH